MKEIGIGEMIVLKRREKGLTQEELAAYFGVTKASVSKWETGSSYPDIILLPKLAAYFNISIDELMCYTPQMTKEDIQRTYIELRDEFGKKPFHEVIEKSQKIIQKYYACTPLLFQMALLYLNHHMLATEKDEREETLRSVISLCDRVMEEGEDLQMVKEAQMVKALTYQLLGEPQKVLGLLGEEIRPNFMQASLLISSFQMLGNVKKAKQLTQINMYLLLNNMLETLAMNLQLCGDDPKKTDEIVRRGKRLIETFESESIFANAAIRFYFQAAIVYIGQGRTEETIAMLGRYTEVGIHELINISFHGDDFFDELDDWFLKSEDIGCTPRSQETINADILAGLSSKELFGALQEDIRYQNLIKRLRSAIHDESK